MPLTVFDPASGLREVAALRTRHSRTYDLGGNRRRSIVSIGTAHVPDDFTGYAEGRSVQWREADPDFALAGSAWAITRGWQAVSVAAGEVGFTYRSFLGGLVQVRLIGLDGRPVPLAPIPARHASNELWWEQIAPGLSIFLRSSVGTVELYKRIESPLAPRSFTWEVVESDPPILDLQVRSQGHDNADLTEPSRRGLGPGRLRRVVELTHAVGPAVSLAGGRRRYVVTETWTGRTIERDPVTNVPRLVTDAVYPILVDTAVNETIAADNDDGHQTDTTTWSVQYGSSGNHVIQFSPQRFPGYRFTTVPIPNAATIDTATLTVKVGSGGTPTGTLFGNDVDDAPAWATNAGPNNMTTTTASVAFAPTGASGSSYAVNVAAIVQEIVNRAGWASNNAIAFGCNGAIAGSSYRYIGDLAAGGQTEAALDITYTAAGGGATWPGWMWSKGGWTA